MRIKPFLTTPTTKFLKNSVQNPKNIGFYRKRYLIEKFLGRKDAISYVPSTFSIAITFRCNFRCPACTFLLRDKHAFDGAKDMSLEKINWILDKFHKDIKTVNLTGGEPTLHPQFSEIVQSVKKRNLRLRMPTNGTLIKQRIEDLKYFDNFNISLDGADYQTFKKIRGGTEQQYKDIIEGIYLLKDRGIPFRLSFLLFEETLSEARKIMDFASKVRPSLLKFESGVPHGSKDFTPLLTESPKVKSFFKEFLRSNDYPFSIRMPIVFDSKSEALYKKNCPQPWNSVNVGWKGDISYCCHMAGNPSIGNIFEGYDFNSPLMVNFRKAMIEHKFPVDCLYCKNRFFEQFLCEFDPKRKKWTIGPPLYQKILAKIL